MQYIFTLLISFAPLIFTIYLSRKYQLADKDRPIIEKQFEIYNKLYLNIVHNQLNEPISIDKAKTNIQALISELYRSETLYNYLSPTLYQLLISLSPITDSKINQIRYQIEIDFENFKYRLGYPCRNKFNNKMKFLGISLFLIIYLIINFMALKVDSNTKNYKEINNNLKIICFLLFVPCSILIVFFSNNITYLLSCYNNSRFRKLFIQIRKKSSKAK